MRTSLRPPPRHPTEKRSVLLHDGILWRTAAELFRIDLTGRDRT